MIIFSFICERQYGTYISLLDHGRIVDSVHNGRRILCDDYGLKVTAEALWRLPGAGGKVEKADCEHMSSQSAF